MAEENELKIEEITTKEPDQLSDEEKSFLEEHKEELTDEQAGKFGLVKEPVEPPVETPTEPSEPLEPPTDDYKTKFRESSREALVLRDRVKQLEARLGTVEQVELPTEEEMSKVYSDWDMLTDFEKSLAKKNYVLEKKLNQVHSIILESKSEKEWVERLDKFLEEAEIMDKFPEIVEKKEDFKKFALKPTHRGVPFEVLAKSFLFDVATPSTPATPGGTMLEPGSGGGVPQPPKTDMTPEQITNLRKTDYKKYRELVKSRKITKAMAS